MNIKHFISKSPEQKLKKEIKTSLNQIKNKNISLSKKSYSINISEIYTTLYKDAFPQILRQSRSNFLDRINKEAKTPPLKQQAKRKLNVKLGRFCGNLMMKLPSNPWFSFSFDPFVLIV